MYEDELLETLVDDEDWEDLEWEDFEDLEGSDDQEAYELMEMYAAEAAEAESEAEADMFVGVVLRGIPLLIRRLAPRLIRYAPLILRAARYLYQRLSRNSQTRHLLRYFPQIIRSALRMLSRVRVQITFNLVLRIMVQAASGVSSGRRPPTRTRPHQRRHPHGRPYPPRPAPSQRRRNRYPYPSRPRSWPPVTRRRPLYGRVYGSWRGRWGGSRPPTAVYPYGIRQPWSGGYYRRYRPRRIVRPRYCVL